MSFSPAELRELVALKDAITFSSSITDLSSYFKPDNSRIQLKNLKILENLIQNISNEHKTRLVDFRFFEQIETVNETTGQIITKDYNSSLHNQKFDILIECIGFYQKNNIYPAFQDQSGKINCPTSHLIHSNIYCCGWAKTGPKGTLVDSMIEAEKCAKEIIQDFAQDKTHLGPPIELNLKSLRKWIPSFE